MQSLFGMNVNLLKDSPDWRWFILLAGTIVILTLVVWLAFKYIPVCNTQHGRAIQSKRY
jgi:Mg2+ and Co2+ transporter CorA